MKHIRANSSFITAKSVDIKQQLRHEHWVSKTGISNWAQYCKLKLQKQTVSRSVICDWIAVHTNLYICLLLFTLYRTQIILTQMVTIF